MKKLIIALISVMVLISCMFVIPTSAAPADALHYADFNNGPMAEPEQSMQATDNGGSLYINNDPINAEASIVDGAMKLTLGTSGYYGFNNTQCAFRSVDGTLTSYKYLVLRMKGEYGTENTPGAGGLMMCIGGGDGPHMGTFLSSGSDSVSPFLDPNGCYMPLITQEYQYFVIALSQSNVRVNPDKLVSGINFNNSGASVTVYIDEIFLTSEIPEGFVSSGKKPLSSSGEASVDTSGGSTSVPEISTNVGTNSGTVVKNVVVSSSGSTMSIVFIILLSILVVINLAVIILILLKLTSPRKE